MRFAIALLPMARQLPMSTRFKRLWTLGLLGAWLSIFAGNAFAYVICNPYATPSTTSSDTVSPKCGGGDPTPPPNYPPIVSITSPANNASFTAPANVSVTASATDSDGVAKVDFFDGATLVGTDTVFPYSVALANLAAGTHTFTARATDNLGASATSAAVSIIVDTPPTVTVTGPANNVVFVAPATITMTATTSDADGTIAKVDFFDGATLAGTATAAPYSVTLANVAVGAHTLTARATDNLGFSTTSAAVSIQVNAPPPPAAGATPGNFSVNQNGGATYTIPITVPPGTAGMVPKLALSYDKQIQNDLLGVGWSVSGLSQIRRCGATIVLDGFKGGVNFDPNDRFCLDGQRLIAINNGGYGANGTEYRTEKESFSKIISYRDDTTFTGNGPQYFRVTSKSGVVTEYGVTLDSRIEAQGIATVRLWALNKVQDTKSNYLTISYSKDNANGEYHPTRIDYTGNSGAVVAPYNSVCFIYDNDPNTTPACDALPTTTRPDIIPSYEGGSVIKTTRRLSHIQTYADAILVRSYRLTYDNNGAVGGSRLLSVKECGSDGVCLAATTFTSDDATIGFGTTYTSGVIDWGYDAGAAWVDFDGDGRADYCRRVGGVNGSSSYIQCTLSTGTGFGATYTSGVIDWGYDAGAQWVDFDGDGKADYCRRVGNVNGSSSYIQCTLSTGTGFGATYTSGVLDWGYDAGWAWADFNGDGKADYCRRVGNVNGSSSYIQCTLSTGVGFGATYTSGLVDWGYNSGVGWVDFKGAGKADYCRRVGNVNGSSSYISCSTSFGPINGALTSVTNGFGAKTTVTFKPITDNTVYTKDTNAAYPYQDIQNPTYVVSNYTTSDGIGGNLSFSYYYLGAKAHLQGGGWLGFRRIQSVNDLAGIRNTADYNQTYDGTHGLPNYLETALVSNSHLVKSTQHFWHPVSFTTGKQIFASLDGTLEQTFEINQLATAGPVTRINTDYVYDAFGNQTQITTNYNDGNSRTTNNSYTYDTVNWIPGLLTQSQVTSATTTPTPVTSPARVSTFTYEANTGLLTSTTVQPNSVPDVSLTTSYTFDSFGNKISTTVGGAGMITRSDSASYDGRGQFVTQTTNALGHSETLVFDPKWGALVSQTGPNGLATTWAYDGFGRKILETRADGTTTGITYAAASAGYSITTQASGSPAVTAYFDILDRPIRAQTQGFDGATVYQDTQYDAPGRVTSVSRNYVSGQLPQWTRHTYDTLGRLLTTTAPDGGVARISYNGLTVSVTNPLNQTTSQTKNSQGQLVVVTDALGNTLRYAYDLFGNATSTTDAAGNTTTMTYDIRGRKTGMNDPDMGVWSYTYDALGELLSQTDAKGQVVSMTYDKLGRLLSRGEAEGISTWTYDTAVKGIGKVATLSGPNGYQQLFSYDPFGRPNRVQTIVETESYLVDTAYDTLGRVDTVTYPVYDGQSARLAVQNVYNPVGFLEKVRDAANSLLPPYWQANAMNAQGQITQETLGNSLITQHVYNDASGYLQTIVTGPSNSIQNLSYAFDLVGNLVSRKDNNQLLTESFGYDALNRLVSSSGVAVKTYTYDNIGNLTYKSDVGNYTYALGTRPHAVASTTGTINNTYTYDANGNMLTGAGRSLTYTSFNQPGQITLNGATTRFTYDPGRNRLTKTTATNKTVYIGGLYERVISGTVIEHKHYVSGANGLVAFVTKRNTGVNDVRYLHKDHLDSIDVITDETGAIKEHLSFDPHGKRRSPNWQDSPTAITSATTKGYTGHEMDDDLGLINVRAREYDPVLGRFLTPDTIIPFPDNAQSYNRYTYVNNDPLSYTDPDGHCCSLRQLLGASVGLPLVAPTALTVAVGAVYVVSQAVMQVGGAFIGTGYVLGGYAGAAAGAYSLYETSEAYNDGARGGDLFQVAVASGLYAYNRISLFTGGYQAWMTDGAGAKGLAVYAEKTAERRYIQRKISAAVERFAEKHGMSLYEFNALLFAISEAGNGIAGSHYKAVQGLMAGFYSREHNNLGLPFDVVDTVLAYQGLPTASSLQYMLSSERGLPLNGHSLGAIDVTNLYAAGLTGGYASVSALPFGVVATMPGNFINIGDNDIVNGFRGGLLINFDANVIHVPFSNFGLGGHGRENYGLE